MGTATLGVQTIMIGAQFLSCNPVYGIIAMAVGAACVAFATAEAQESLGYGNWLKDTVGMSDEVYNGVMVAVNIVAVAINIVGVKQCFKEITVVFFLAPYASALGMGFLFLFEENCFFVHLLNPIAAIVSYLWFERGGDIELKDSLFGIIPTILYSIVYFIMVVFIGEENGGWPDFYGFTFGGRMYLVPVVIIGMYVATFAISTIELHIRRKIGEK